MSQMDPGLNHAERLQKSRVNKTVVVLGLQIMSVGIWIMAEKQNYLKRILEGWLAANGTGYSSENLSVVLSAHTVASNHL